MRLAVCVLDRGGRYCSADDWRTGDGCVCAWIRASAYGLALSMTMLVGRFVVQYRGVQLC